MLDDFQLLVSCVAPGVLGVVGGYRVAPHPHSLGFVDSSSARLAGDRHLALSIDFRYVLNQHPAARSDLRWSNDIVAYMYALRTSAGVELVTWHWHPGVPNTPPNPHLHLGPAARIGTEGLHRAHLPTGIVTVADIVRCAITKFRVEPLRGDWQAILHRADRPTET